MSDTKKKILVGMSGGVDSSAAALILRDQGHEVAGLTFELWDSEDGTCGTKNDVRDAAEVCRVLGIPHYVVDFRKEFRQQVMERFVQDYRHGLTPNPCVDCNRTIKFAAFADKAKELGYDYIATGHYGRVDYDPADGRWHLTMGDDDSKDQSYVLWSLTQEQLSRMVLPLYPYRKEQIREMARQAGLPVFAKKDSQDICFIPDGDFASFLCRYTGEEPPKGSFIDRDGKVLGTHETAPGTGHRLRTADVRLRHRPGAEHSHPHFRRGTVPQHPHRRGSEPHRGGSPYRTGTGHSQDPLCGKAGRSPAHPSGRRTGAGGV